MPNIPSNEPEKNVLWLDSFQRGESAQANESPLRRAELEACAKVKVEGSPLSEAQLDLLEEQIPTLAEGAFNTAFLKTLAQGHNATVARDGEMVGVAPDDTVTKKDEMPEGGNLPSGTLFSP